MSNLRVHFYLINSNRWHLMLTLKSTSRGAIQITVLPEKLEINLFDPLLASRLMSMPLSWAALLVIVMTLMARAGG